MHRFFFRCPLLDVPALAALALVVLLSPVAQGDELTARQKNEIRRIRTEIDRAGRLFKADNLDGCVKAVIEAQERMAALVSNPSAELLEAIQPEYQRLSKAHELLTQAGQELPELLPLPAAMSGDVVSFRGAVAPILVNHCGRCHVRGNRGNFSAATFQALANSGRVSAGLPDTSRLIEVIVDGEMPPNGSVPESELDVLKNWIAQGAKFDGEDPNQNLEQLLPEGDRPAAPRGAPEIRAPEGKETVSFGRDVAPLLIESCGQCHIETNQPRGNFSMADFQRLLRGGDGGSPIVPGKPEESQLVRRLKGEGVEVMPPSGKLDDARIAVVETWIREGATFDGMGANLPLARVAARARADAQSHAELTADRDRLATDNWNRFMPGVRLNQARSKNLRVLGNTDPDRLEAVARIGESLIPELVDRLGLAPDPPFLKGNITLFVLRGRYDFTELGTMLARQDFPREVTGFWDFNTVDAYAAAVLNESADPESLRLSLAQQLAALAIANLGADVPRWFADGVGYWGAARALSGEDGIDRWDSEAERLTAAMQKPDDFLQGRMPTHEAGLVGYQFVKQLRSNSGAFRKLLQQLQETGSFEQAFQTAYGQPVESLFQTGTGNGRPARPRQNR